MMNERENPTPTTDPPSRDAVFAVLQNSRRRTVLALLTASDRTLTTNDLTEELVVRERDEPITEVSDEALTRIAISLHHVHIPKLVDTGLVEYDERRRIVEPTEKLARLEPRLPAVEQERLSA